MILTVIPFDNYNLFRDSHFVNSLENKKYINRKKSTRIFRRHVGEDVNIS